MSDVDYRLNDADEHYYEPDDCFTRHIETKFRERTVRVERNGPGPGRMWVGDERCHFFRVGAGDSVGAPGAMKAFLRGESDEGGSIVNIASVSGVRPSPGTAAYAAAKAGLLALTSTLAVEWAPKVRINAVIAGLIRTEQAGLHYGDEAGIASVGATIPLGRMGEPRDVGDACLFLASPLARYVSGASLLVHGGGERPAFLSAAKNVSREQG